MRAEAARVFILIGALSDTDYFFAKYFGLAAAALICSMDRIPEPDLMNDAAQAQAYALADFSEPHNQFVGQFRRCFPRSRPTRVLDLGCGTADVTLRFARAYSECCMVGIDGAPAMLRHARGAVAGAGMDGRIQLMCVRLPQVTKPTPTSRPGAEEPSAPVRRGKGPLDLFLFPPHLSQAMGLSWSSYVDRRSK